MLRMFFSLIVVFTLCSNSFAQWGTLKGRFILKGKVKAPAKLIVNKDVNICGKHGLMDESLKVGKDGGLANVVVYARGDKKKVGVAVKKIHPDYAKLKGTKVAFDNKNCRFSPHVQTLWTEQTLIIGNRDTVAHNSFGTPSNNKAFNNSIIAAGKLEVKLKLGEKIPMKIACTIHPWMAGYVVVRPDPYMAVSAKDGSFTIKNLPVGVHHFQLWHEKAGYVQYVTINGKSKKIKKGLYKVTIKAGENDLGDIILQAKDYKRIK